MTQLDTALIVHVSINSFSTSIQFKGGFIAAIQEIFLIFVEDMLHLGIALKPGLATLHSICAIFALKTAAHTMDTTEKTPLWLELRKEYIDDNFSKLQAYLKTCSTGNRKDAFYTVTIELLRQRVEDLVGTLSERPVYEEERDRKELEFNVSLLATYLLVDGAHALALPAYVAFMGELRSLNPRVSDAIVKAVATRLVYEKVTALGFGWSDLEKIGTDLFAYNAANLARFDTLLKKPLLYSRYGTALLTVGGLFLTPETRENARKLLMNGANSVDTGIGVMLRTKSSEKLKQSLEESIVDIDEYANDFIRRQNEIKAKQASAKKKVCFEGEEVTVRIKAIKTDGTIMVETADADRQTLEGTIRFEKSSLVYYYTNTLYQYLQKGDYLKATVTDAARGYFSIERQLVTFFVEDTKREAGKDSEFLCMLIDDKPSYYGWLNELGVAFFSPKSGKYSRGDFAILSVKGYGKGDKYGKIDAEIVRDSDRTFEEQKVRRDCIRAFAEQAAPPTAGKENEGSTELAPVVIRLLTRQMFEHQKSLLTLIDRFRLLANANVMAELVGDEVTASYIRFARTYLRAIVQFVRKEDFRSVRLVPGSEFCQAKSTLIRMSVIDLLKEYGRRDNSEKLARAIEDFEETIPMLARLARLIQTANTMQDTLSGAALNVIRREIIKTLSLETENDTDLEGDAGIYLGVESGTQEFKTSMVYPANNRMQPDENVQNQNVLRGVCAFLNSTTGGTLYLGVSDMGTVTGLENDMKYLKCGTIDSYMRYVQDLAMKHFGMDTLPYLRIEPMYDNRVVAIHVEPHPYRVVELNGTAYLRVNAESREMPESVRQELIARKVFTDRDRAAAVSLLQHACTIKRCVVLHDYASSNSGRVADRKVEAYDVRPDDGLVIGFDRNKFATRIFSINRIGYVEILENEPWKYPASHEKIEVDVFHMTGDKPVHVSLQLDLMAKNLLVEEYPSAKTHIQPHKGDVNIWYFDTNVYKMEGIGRFYIGLANHIRILDAPELEEYVRDFCERYL